MSPISTVLSGYLSIIQSSCSDRQCDECIEKRKGDKTVPSEAPVFVLIIFDVKYWA